METEALLSQVEELLKPWARWSKRPQPDIVTISVSRSNLLACMEALVNAKWGYLAAITGMHVPGVENPSTEEKQWTRAQSDDNTNSLPPMLGDSYVVLYHFCEGGAVLNLRVHPPSDADAKVPSVCDYFPVATVYERELQELLGVKVTDTPENSRLVLPDEWPDGVYPLRKSFTGLETPEA